ncbi:potassium-transporting ATPase subunit C [Dactylosporangium sp. NPDC051541]|uniref:potassium-transporting ATPase subunit C n=1 Tax=Dactylosporangium sp. NPDC051541 TaxID=3363977 RepID=UPI0037B97DBA
MRLPAWLAQHLAALRALVVLTLILGLAYPLVLVAVAHVPGLAGPADGSLRDRDGKPVGSALIGQSFTDAQGNPLRRYFQSRPSAAGDGYDPTATGASNLGPSNVKLLELICARSKAVGDLEGVDGSRPYCTKDGHAALQEVDGVEVPVRGDAPDHPVVPPDAVTASGSGLDPHISVAYANLQVPRVARERNMSEDAVRRFVSAHTQPRALGFMGEPAVNVLDLNVALDQD